MSSDLDLIVAGGGPIGLAAAIEARLEGLRVLVLDPRRAPADKACGEGVMPSGVAALRRLGVDPPGADIDGISYHRAGRVARAYFSSGTGRGIRRTVLHHALAQRADEVGVDRAAVKVAQLSQTTSSVRVGGSQARWLIGADGLHSTVRRLIGSTVDEPNRSRRYGLRRHYRVPATERLVEVHWGRRSEAYLTPVAEDLVGVALLGPGTGGGFDELLGEFPALAHRFAQADAQPVRGAGPLRQRVSRQQRGRVLLVGDAAGYVDALTGEGLTLGLASAHLAVRAILEDRAESYASDYRAAARRSTLVTRVLLGVSSVPVGRALVVPAAARAPHVMRALVDLLA